MKKFVTLCALASVLLLNTPTFAATQKGHATKAKHKISKKHKHQGTHGKNDEITPKSIGAGALSLLIWPGIGQLMNDEPMDKNATHAILGFTGIFRIWSCYDAVVDRQGGVWENRI